MAIQLTSLIPEEKSLNARRTWVEFKGVQFEIRYVSRATMQRILDQCTGAEYVPGTAGSRVRKIDNDKLSRAVATTIVLNWQKATIASLQRILPLNVPEGTNVDEPIPFTADNLMAVVGNAHDLDGFLQECATDASIFRHPEDEVLTKNS